MLIGVLQIAVRCRLDFYQNQKLRSSHWQCWVASLVSAISVPFPAAEFPHGRRLGYTASSSSSSLPLWKKRNGKRINYAISRILVGKVYKYDAFEERLYCSSPSMAKFPASTSKCGTSTLARMPVVSARARRGPRGGLRRRGAALPEEFGHTWPPNESLFDGPWGATCINYCTERVRSGSMITTPKGRVGFSPPMMSKSYDFIR